jgi:acetyl esterase/lipase
MKIQEGQVKIKDRILVGKAGDRDLEADLFLPPIDTKERPAILIVHGGGWREGDRTQLRGYAILLARLGFVTLSTSYRLSSEAIWPAQIQDVNCALRYLRANSDSLGIDPERIGISGNSAGGHLALMAASQIKRFEGQGGHTNESSHVKAVCAIYPPARIKKLDNTDPLDNAFLALMGEKAEQSDYDAASPINYINKYYVPTMLIHGSKDNVVSLRDTNDLYKKLLKYNIPAEIHIFSEEDHAFDGKNEYGRVIADLQGLFFLKYL